jgi:hypothetical protein
MARPTYVIPSTALYPLDEEHRLRIYARVGKRLRVVAATDFEGLGPALRQLDADEAEHGRRLCDLGAIGVLDAVAGRWLIPCWHRPERETTIGRPTAGRREH